MLNVETQEELQGRLSRYQELYNDILAPFGRQAPCPQQDESLEPYRRRTLRFMQPFLSSASEWKTAALDGKVTGKVLRNAESDIVKDMRVIASDPRQLAQTPAARVDTLDPSLREIKRAQNGIVVTEFYGPKGQEYTASFVRALSIPGRRVVSWNSVGGRTRANGTYF
jgi:hypothetical protein